MSEPGAVEAPVPGGESGKSTPAGFGYTLAQARVRAGLSVEQAAARLRLHARQLRAIESEDLQALPAAAYISGFVRNYARELKIDPAALLEDLNAKLKIRGLDAPAPQPGPVDGVHVPTLDDRGWRQLVLAGIVMALVCAGLIGLWMAHSRPRSGDSAAAPARAIAVPPATAAAPEAPATAAAPSAAVTPTASDSGVSAATPPAAPVSSAGAAPAPAASPPAPLAAVPAGPAMSGLVLRFNERSWVEVSQPNGRVLLSRNGEAGSIELLNTAAPMILVVGRADAVQVEYRGQAVNLKPYANSNGVARLVLADGRVSSGGPNR